MSSPKPALTVRKADDDARDEIQNGLGAGSSHSEPVESLGPLLLAAAFAWLDAEDLGAAIRLLPMDRQRALFHSCDVQVEPRYREVALASFFGHASASRPTTFWSVRFARRFFTRPGNSGIETR